MPTTLTLKNIPDAVNQRLKSAAELHWRSVNNEAIVRLEAMLIPSGVTPAERLARAHELRARWKQQVFLSHEIDALKCERT